MPVQSAFSWEVAFVVDVRSCWSRSLCRGCSPGSPHWTPGGRWTRCAGDRWARRNKSTVFEDLLCYIVNCFKVTKEICQVRHIVPVRNAQSRAAAIPSRNNLPGRAAAASGRLAWCLSRCVSRVCRSAQSRGRRPCPEARRLSFDIKMLLRVSLMNSCAT